MHFIASVHIPLIFCTGTGQNAEDFQVSSIIHRLIFMRLTSVSMVTRSYSFLMMEKMASLTVSYTSREKDWSEPVVLPKNVNHRLVYLKGYALSADGKKMYFTSTKSPVVGGYDIMMSELKGTTWTEPQNLMLPINSKTNDGCPSVTTMATHIYFMRCDKMDQTKPMAANYFRAEKKANGQWDEPKELPANINTGNSQTPRIMADGETLIFSSNKMGSTKGGMDLYMTKLSNGNWSNPVPMDFVNTRLRMINL